MTPRNHTLVRASAGTGKTYQLVQTYADFVQGGCAPGEMLAITFTKKAAGELRGRIRKELRKRGVGPEILSELSRASICNFHVLSLQWLKNLGHISGVDEQTTLLGGDGRDAAMFRAACEAAWFNGDATVQTAVQSLAPYFEIDTQLPIDLWHAVSRAREDGKNMMVSDDADDTLLAVYHAEALRLQQHTTLLQLRQTLQRARNDVSKTTRNTIDDFLDQQVPDVGAPLQLWTESWSKATTKLHRRGALSTLITKEMLSFAKKEVTEPLLEERCAQLRVSMATLLRSGYGEYERRKAALNVIDFGDLVERFVTLMQQHPEVHRQVRKRYRAVLVDEAQDTNRLQRQLVRLLVGIDGQGVTPGDAPAAMYVVGDKKQAIYTFRGADRGAFDAFAADVKKLGGTEQTLTLSRRSTKPLVTAINHLGQSLLGEHYEPLSAMQSEEAGHPSKAVTVLEYNADEGEPKTVAAYIKEQIDGGATPGAHAILLRAMTHAADYTRALADVGVATITSGGGGFYDQQEVKDWLALCGWLANPKDRFSAAVVLRSPMFGLSDAALLWLFDRGHNNKAPIDRLWQGLPLQETHPWNSELATEQDALMRAHQKVSFLVRAAKSLGVVALLTLANELLQIRATYLPLQNGEQRVANWDRLIDLGAQFEAGTRGGLARFIHEQYNITGGRCSLPSVHAQGDRAVLVSTMHQAKGLQFPVVILPDLRRRARHDSTRVSYRPELGIVFSAVRRHEKTHCNTWNKAREAVANEDEAERRRLLYVAVTRAQKRLVVLRPDPTVTTQATQGTFASWIEPWLDCAPELIEHQTMHTTDTGADLPVQRIDVKAAAIDPDATTALLSYTEVLTPAVQWSVTALNDYHHCLRRGFLRHGLGVRQRPPLYSTAHLGTLAHGVLQGLETIDASSDVDAFVTCQLRSLGVSTQNKKVQALAEDLVGFLDSDLGHILRKFPKDHRRHELAFVLPLGDARVTGQIDLLIVDDNECWVIDFKYSNVEDEFVPRYAGQLDAYASAVMSLVGTTQTVRTSLVPLKSKGCLVDRYVTKSMAQQWRQDAARVIAEAAEQSVHPWEQWPGIPMPDCKKSNCGFIGQCHGARTHGV